jgi:hypothetical protein
LRQQLPFARARNPPDRCNDTPTNNTANTSSAYSSKIAPGDAGPFARPSQGAAADAASRAFGVPAAVFANALHLDDPAESIATAMNTALWPAWGYFLDHRLAGVTTETGLGQFRGHFIGFVRGTGPLSPLRIGKEPYGVLPVTSLDLWSPVDATDVTDRAVTILRNLGDPFNRALTNVPRLGATQDPDQDLSPCSAWTRIPRSIPSGSCWDRSTQTTSGRSWASRSTPSGGAGRPPARCPH